MSVDIIVNEEDLIPNGYTHQSKVEAVFRSKNELWKFLAGDGEAFLPPVNNASM